MSWCAEWSFGVYVVWCVGLWTGLVSVIICWVVCGCGLDWCLPLSAGLCVGVDLIGVCHCLLVYVGWWTGLVSALSAGLCGVVDWNSVCHYLLGCVWVWTGLVSAIICWVVCGCRLV